MIDSVRRVVTGETADGKSVFTHVEEVEPIVMGETLWYGVWGWDAPPSLPYISEEPYAPRSAFPDPAGNGMRLNVITIPAGSGVTERTGSGRLATGTSAAYAELTAAQPHGRVVDEATGMHSTDSVEIGVVIDGEIAVEQDDSEEVTLRPGDFYVQNGARHAWRNRSAAPCTIAFVVTSAERRS